MTLKINSPLIRELREEDEFRTPKDLFLKFLIFVILFFVVAFVECVIMAIGFSPKLMAWATEEMVINNTTMITNDMLRAKLLNLLLDPEYTHVVLFATAGGTLTVFFYCRIIEGRPLSSMGFHKKGALPKYLIGLVVGFGLFSLVVLLAWLTGSLTWNGFKGGDISKLVLVFIGFLIQGMSEEVIFRGSFMTTILRHYDAWWGILLNSMCFSLAHFANKGITVLAAINLVLYAAMISIYVLKTNDLWGACAIHSIWNFAQGNFYGLPVSGIDTGATVFSMSLNEGKELFNGGVFGLEAGLPTTIVMTLTIIVLLMFPDKQEKTEEAAA
ncbi:MAG: CPBP family intramembrane metalloprotease [Oscillospiraceae bacterium]|nr:CPBP family intramembrane metalloprotease [Oscillospiraceae bacterium]